MERPKRGWYGSDTLKSDVPLPALGPAFSTMDDAARYAHRQIGSRRDVEYGGVILQSLETGYFYATEPLADGPNSFDHWKVLKVDSNSKYLHPEGYRCVADYHSHPDMYEAFKANNPEYSDRQIRALNSFYSDIDLAINILERGFFSASYLSGPDGSLLKHVTTGSDEEHRFGVWLDTKQPFGRPDGYDGVLENFFKKTATVSRLSIVLGNPVWGGALGTVPAQWQPYAPFVSRTYESPPCGRVYSGLDAALQSIPRAMRQVFVLKHVDKDDYVLVEPLRNQAELVSPQQVLPINPDGVAQMPEKFRLAGVYLGEGAAATRQAALEPRLYRHFFTPLELAFNLHHARHARQSLAGGGDFSIYRRLVDDALLQYTCSYSDAEAALYRLDAHGRVVDTDIDSALLAGTTSPRKFILRVAAAGQLKVLKTSRTWDREGVVDAQWRPYSAIPVPVLSPAFNNPDDAARWAHIKIGDRRDKEYGGAILKQGARYFATEPVAGAAVLFDFRSILATDEHDYFIAPFPYSCQALYHSHPNDDDGVRQHNPQFSADQVSLFLSFFSSADQAFVIGNRDFAPAHYLSGSQGVLLKYVSSNSANEQKLLKQLTGEIPIEPFTEFEGAVWNLASAGDLRVVGADRVWGGVRGRVSRGWTLGSPVSPAGTVQEQPFFTPIASMGHVAVLVALSNLGLLPAGAYQGFVLKHQTASTYIATLPTTAGSSLANLFPSRANGQPKLPSNYRLVGVYYSAASEAPARLPANEAWLYRRFASPALLVQTMSEAIASRGLQIAGLGLKLYVQTADKALLHWQVPAAETSTELFTIAGQTVTDNGNEAALLDGTLSPRDFVRRVVRAGELTVLQQGGLWSILGPVHDSERLPLGLGAVALSAKFLSADDAARQAHARIGVRRGTAYGGYILKGADERYVFTEPLIVHGDGFASDLLRPAAGSGLLTPPPGYQLHARYSSHAALSSDDLGRQRRLGWTLAELEVNATMFSDREIRSVIESRLPAYLSGSPNNLISYTPSGSANELLVLANTTREPGGHGYFERLESGALKPVDIVSRLADAGTLQVQVESALWGPRIRVYADWTPNFEYAQTSRQTPAFGAIFATQEAAALDAHIREYGRSLDAQGCAAYLLKHPQRDEYVVSELLPVAHDKYWLSDHLRDVDYLSAGHFVNGFVPVGLLYAQQWVPSGLQRVEAWLTQFFVTPELLSRAEHDALHLPRAHDLPVLAVYISTLDGALLRYQPAAVSLIESSGNSQDMTVKGMSLARGSLDIHKFVSLIAEAGDLQVLYSSQCWDRRGPVHRPGMIWHPYGHFIRRRLGPAFEHQDDAARHARSLIEHNSNGAKGGLILKRPDGLFVATEPLKVPREDFDPKWIFPDEVVSTGGFPAAHTIVARYRASPMRELPFALDVTQTELYRNMLSTRVIASALMTPDARLVREYLFGSDGCVVSYTRSQTALEAELKKDLLPLNRVRADLLENLIERQIRNGSLSPGAFVARLGNAGVLRVVEGSRVWGLPRTITAPFVPNVDRPDPLLIRASFADPPFSPVFAQEQDAVRYAHDHCWHRESLQFGYIFKSKKNGHYMVSMPLVRQSYRDYGQVFPQGQLPQGYLLKGFYLCATSEAFTPADDPLHRAFFSPTDIDTGIRFSVHGVTGKKLTFYLSCADGALLRYQYLGTDEQLLSLGLLQATRQQLLQGTARMLDFVHGLAGMGNLDVLIEGRIWSGTTRVSQHWRPGNGNGFNETWLPCGPLFSHADDAARYVQRMLAPFRGLEYLAAVLGDPGRTSFIGALPATPGLDTAQQLRLFYSGPSGPVQPKVLPTDRPVPFPAFAQLYQMVAPLLMFKNMTSIQSSDPKEQAVMNNFAGPAFFSFFLRVVQAHPQRPASLYLSARDGALLKYIPSLSRVESDSLASGQHLQPSGFLKRMTEVGQLYVLDRGEFWRNEGRLANTDIAPRKGLQTEAPQDDEPLSIRDRDEL